MSRILEGRRQSLYFEVLRETDDASQADAAVGSHDRAPTMAIL